MIFDEGRRTALQLLMIFSEDGGRRTEDVFSGSSFSYQTPDPKPQTRSRLVLSLLLNQEPGREASEPRTDLKLFPRTSLENRVPTSCSMRLFFLCLLHSVFKSFEMCFGGECGSANYIHLKRL